MTQICNRLIHIVRLETPRLILREHDIDDLIPLHDMLSDPLTTQYIPEMHKADLSETEGYLYSVIRDAEASLRLRYNLAVEDRESGRLIGSVSLHLIDSSPDGAHFGLGYFIRPDLWCRGFATEAARAALCFIFTGGAWRVSASTLTENFGSRRVLEKCGMRQEGLLKSHTWHEGTWKDCAVYRLLREEYRERDEVCSER